jgi:RHS repeat-associated protein
MTNINICVSFYTFGELKFPAGASVRLFKATKVNLNRTIAQLVRVQTCVARARIWRVQSNKWKYQPNRISKYLKRFFIEKTLYLKCKMRLANYTFLSNQETSATIAVPSYTVFSIERGAKRYELTNHLGNKLVVMSDKKIPICATSVVSYYTADVVTANDYSPFGAPLAGRSYTAPNSDYRFGFNGKENDNEVKGNGNQQDYGMRIYDPRLGRFLSVDPLTGKFAMLTPYQFASNRPIDGIDMDGLEYATYNITVHNRKVLDISVTTDYELKNAGTKGPGIQYNYIHLDEVGNAKGEPESSFVTNRYGIYGGENNPKLP